MPIALSLFTKAADKAKADAGEELDDADVFLYRGLKRTTRRGLWLFTPVFLFAFGLNVLLPTTRDAIVMAATAWLKP